MQQLRHRVYLETEAGVGLDYRIVVGGSLCIGSIFELRHCDAVHVFKFGDRPNASTMPLAIGSRQ